jgi:hypothetical protein
MRHSLKLAALFLWVLSAIFIKEDAKRKIKGHQYPVASYDVQKKMSSQPTDSDSASLTGIR